MIRQRIGIVISTKERDFGALLVTLSDFYRGSFN